MSFDDLPDDWSHLPLDTPGLGADVADLFLGVADRLAGAVALLLTDADGRLVQPCVVGGVPPDADPATFGPFLEHLGGVLGRGQGGVVLVRGRDGSVLLTDADRGWHEEVLSACRASGMRLVGAYLATPAGVRPFPAALSETRDLAS
jgi:hypothetical protein